MEVMCFDAGFWTLIIPAFFVQGIKYSCLFLFVWRPGGVYSRLFVHGLGASMNERMAMKKKKQAAATQKSGAQSEVVQSFFFVQGFEYGFSTGF